MSFSRTAAEIDKSQTSDRPEVSTRTFRTTRPGAASAQDEVVKRNPRKYSQTARPERNHTQTSGAASEAAGERGEAGGGVGGAARGVSLQILFAMVTSCESPRGTEHSMTRFSSPLFHFNSY